MTIPVSEGVAPLHAVPRQPNGTDDDHEGYVTQRLVSRVVPTVRSIGCRL